MMKYFHLKNFFVYKSGLTIAISLFPPRALREFPSEQICQFAVLGAALVIIYLQLFYFCWFLS